MFQSRHSVPCARSADSDASRREAAAAAASAEWTEALKRAANRNHQAATPAVRRATSPTQPVIADIAGGYDEPVRRGVGRYIYMRGRTLREQPHKRFSIVDFPPSITIIGFDCKIKSEGAAPEVQSNAQDYIASSAAATTTASA